MDFEKHFNVTYHEIYIHTFIKNIINQSKMKYINLPTVDTLVADLTLTYLTFSNLYFTKQ